MIKKLLLLCTSALMISHMAQAQCTADILQSSPMTACFGSSITLNATQGGTSYQWMLNGTPIAGANSDSYSTIINTISSQNYTVEIAFNSCVDTSDILAVNINSPLSISATYTDPTSLTSYDGSIEIYGVPNSMTVVVSYTKNYTAPITMIVMSSGGLITISNLGTGIYDDITVTGNNNCVSNQLGPYVLQDWVWPGDVNYDLIVDNNDVLQLGLAYGQTGIVRTGASTNWIPQDCADWGVLQGNGMDMKHADCNGDGIIDINDTSAISQNYGETHLKTQNVAEAKSTAFPDLYFDLTGITFSAGTTVDIPIKLGTNSQPMNDIMGIAAQIKINGISLDTAPTIMTTTSWLGNAGNSINFARGISGNQTDWTLVRTDHTNVSGDGTIGVLTVEVPQNISGQSASLHFDDVSIIDNVGSPVTDFNVVNGVVPVIPLDIPDVLASQMSIQLYPVPAINEIFVTCDSNTYSKISIVDNLGRSILQTSLNGLTNRIDISQLGPGVYYATISGSGTSGKRKFIKI